MTRPFLKWAGGKGQIVEKLALLFPPELTSGAIHKYVEPMAGGGAMLFFIADHGLADSFYISDANLELILCYLVIQGHVEALVNELADLEKKYLALPEDLRKRHFYETRTLYNQGRQTVNYEYFSPAWIGRAVMTIFLNRTCFNGLYRVNSKGEFNVPFGDYKNPRICDERNLMAVHGLLEHTEIRPGGYDSWHTAIDQDAFVYFDPPYRPLSSTANFTSYQQGAFDDGAQKALAQYIRKLDAQKGARLMLSNSDPTNTNPEDLFFEELYEGFTFSEIPAVRIINSDASKRGPINELAIMNYWPEVSEQMKLLQIIPRRSKSIKSPAVETYNG